MLKQKAGEMATINNHHTQEDKISDNIDIYKAIMIPQISKHLPTIRAIDIRGNRTRPNIKFR